MASVVVTNAERNLHEGSDSRCNHRQQSYSRHTKSARYQPVSQPQRHCTDLLGRKSCDQTLHLAPDASHQFSDSRTVDTTQVHLFLRNQKQWDSQFSQITVRNNNQLVAYFYNSAEFCITDRQLLMSILGDHLLQHFLQTLANFPLGEGSGSWEVKHKLNIQLYHICNTCIYLRINLVYSWRVICEKL